MAQSYQQRPSSLLGLTDDPYVAYCIDQAVLLAGSHAKSDEPKIVLPIG